MTVGSKPGLLSPSASRIVLAIARRNGKASISIDPKAPEKRDPPKDITSCDAIVLHRYVLRSFVEFIGIVRRNVPHEVHGHGLDLEALETFAPMSGGEQQKAR
jgi:hypothetical protein